MNLTTRNIHITLGDNHILHGVDIDVSQREIIGILGPNGSGKSTLLKSIYRTLTPDEGSIYIDGQDLSSMSYRQSAQMMAVLAQHNFYNFEFSVREVVLMGRAPY